MSELNNFMIKRIDANKVIEYVASEDLVDNDGKPVVWKLRALKPTEEEGIRAMAKRGGGLDDTVYSNGLVVGSVIYPNLKSTQLQAAFGVSGEVDLLNSMLLFGEKTRLMAKILEINKIEGLSKLVDDAKN